MNDLLGIGYACPPSRRSTCGYCSPSGSRSVDQSSVHISDFVASLLTCECYQKMIDIGWRRSGTYCYKPDLARSCCPQYPIKLDALKFNPSKSQKKVVNRWNRYILYGNEEDRDDSMDLSDANQSTHAPKKPKSKNVSEFSLISSIHASERDFLKDCQPTHIFEVALEVSNYSEEKYMLFKLYQEQVHKDISSRDGFTSFLVDSPLKLEPIPYLSPPPEHLPKYYGSYHQTYRLDGKLIAVGVLDILPSCVSSVYFMYDNAWERYSLGKLSAMREASLAREINDAGVYTVDSLYLGFYVHSCPKMKYKAEYSPSYLGDPENFTWWPIKDCLPLLDKYHYTCFAHPDHSLKEPADIESPLVFSPESVKQVYVIDRMGNLALVSLDESAHWPDSDREALLALVNSLGPQLPQRMLFRV